MSAAARIARSLTCVLMLGVPAALWGADGHLLRDDDTPLGTRIRPIAVSGSAYPMDKRYEELNADQVRALKSLWEPMPEADEPPFPKHGFADLMNDIRDVGGAVRARGTLTVVAHVDAAGKVTKVDVYESPNARLQEFVAWRLTQTAFKPALCGGRACAMQFPLSMRFRR